MQNDTVDELIRSGLWITRLYGHFLRGAREKLHSGMGVLQSMCGRSYGIWNSIMEMSGVYKKIPNSLKALYIKEFLDFHRQP